MSIIQNIVADRLKQVKLSASITAKAKADALRESGRKIIDFTVGEPDFPTPNHIVEAGIEALREGHTRYTTFAGTAELRNAIIAKLQEENNLTFPHSTSLLAVAQSTSFLMR